MSPSSVPTMAMTNAPTSAPSPQPSTVAPTACPYFEVDFASLPSGTYVTDQLKDAYLISISAEGGHTPGGAARLFDTSNPGTKAIGDPDLGSPNEACGGPGVGQGGHPDSDYPNCEPLGNVLIIQEVNDHMDIPDDNNKGGVITFEFEEPAQVAELKILDIDSDPTPSVTVSS